MVDQLLGVCKCDVDDSRMVWEESAELLTDGGAQKIGVVGGEVGEYKCGFDRFDFSSLGV